MHVSKHLMGQRLKFRRGNQTPSKLVCCKLIRLCVAVPSIFVSTFLAIACCSGFETLNKIDNPWGTGGDDVCGSCLCVIITLDANERVQRCRHSATRVQRPALVGSGVFLQLNYRAGVLLPWAIRPKSVCPCLFLSHY